MKKLAILIGAIALMLVVIPVSAKKPEQARGGAENGKYIKWKWWKDTNEDIEGYFMKTNSGIVHAWVEHPGWDDAKYEFKPLSKFKNASEEGCDEGYLKENLNWSPKPLSNYIYGEYIGTYKVIFDDFSERYLLCIYPRE